MYLPPVPSRLSKVLTSRFKNLKWAKKKQQILSQFQNLFHRISWKSPKVIGSLSVCAILTGGLVFYLCTTTSATAIIINGQNVGLVHNVNAKTLVESILQAEGKPFGVVAKTHDQISYKNTRVDPAIYQKSAISEQDLAKKIKSYLDGYDLEVNGSVVAVLPTQDAVNKVLKQYQDYYVKPSSENKVDSTTFAEKTNLKQVEVQPSDMKQPDQAFELLLNGEAETTNYTVQPNDSWWLIARKNNMLTDEVLAGNPGATEDTVLQPGQNIKLVNVTPYLTVVSQGTYTGTEVIPYDVQTKTDNSLGHNSSKVITKGSNGTKKVTYSYVQQNGLNIKQDVLKEEVLQAPVTEVIARGPNSQPLQIAYVSRGSSGGSGILSTARSLLGRSYVFGGNSPSGFDCSGFTKYVFASAGISLPRTSYDQYSSGTPVSIDQLKPGDLVFFHTYSKGASHVGIYLGGGNFIHAANPSSGVEISSLSGYYSSHYLGARRY